MALGLAAPGLGAPGSEERGSVGRVPEAMVRAERGWGEPAMEDLEKGEPVKAGPGWEVTEP